MLKISTSGSVGQAITLRIEGRIVGPWVAEVRESCEQVLRKGHALRLHLAEVEFMEVGGVALLLDLRARGVSFIHTPPFIAEQLKSAQATI